MVLGPAGELVLASIDIEPTPGGERMPIQGDLVRRRQPNGWLVHRAILPLHHRTELAQRPWLLAGSGSQLSCHPSRPG